LGILKQLGYAKYIPSDRDDVTHWEAFSGILADATRGVGPAIDRLRRLSRDQISVLFRSVTEALTNVTQHAYMNQRMDGSGSGRDAGWWMFVRQEPRELSITFCDLGVGVPYSVPRLEKHKSWLQESLGKVLRAVGVQSHMDGEIIQATVEYKRSRFQQDHRGNGFGNMLESIDRAGSGRLIISSNRGAYIYGRELSKVTQESRNYSDSIFGTVLYWQIKLPEDQE
jgi:hypothetical protein